MRMGQPYSILNSSTLHESRRKLKHPTVQNRRRKRCDDVLLVQLTFGNGIAQCAQADA